MKKNEFVKELHPLYNAEDEYLYDLLSDLHEITDDVDEAKLFLDWLYDETMLVLNQGWDLMDYYEEYQDFTD